MKKALFILFIFTCFFTPKNIYAENFNARINEELITVTGNPGKSYTVRISVETNSPSTTVYPISFDLPDENTYNTTNTWLTPTVSNVNINNTQATNLSFDLFIPSDTEVGEYYKAVGVSDIVYDNNLGAVVVSIPVIVQVTENGEESTTSTTSSNGTSSATNSTNSTTNNTNSLTPTSIKTKKITPKKTSKPLPEKTADVFSKLIITKITTKFSILNQATNINLTLSNEGNIYSVPLGSIQVWDKKNNPIKFFSLNPNKKLVLPSKSTNFSYQLDLPPYYLGQLKLDVYMISSDSQMETQPTLVKSINILHIDIVPLFIIIFTLILVVRNFSSKKNIFFVLLISGTSLVVCYVLSIKTTHQNYQSETISLNITATVKNQVGLKVLNDDTDAKIIMFVSTNPLGSRLFSLSGNTRSVLDEILTPNEVNHVVNLTASQSAKPVLMMTSGY